MILNLFPDNMSDFESGFRSYTVTAGDAIVTVAPSTDVAVSGTHSLKLTCNSPGTQGYIDFKVLLDAPITPDPATTYAWEAHVYCQGRLTFCEVDIEVPGGTSFGDVTGFVGEPDHALVGGWMTLTNSGGLVDNPNGNIAGWRVLWGSPSSQPVDSFDSSNIELRAGDVIYLDLVQWGPVDLSAPNLTGALGLVSCSFDP